MEKLNSSGKSYKGSLNNVFINNKTKKCMNMEWDSCDHSITKKEILNSLKQLHNGRTLGTDGLPPNVYKSFWIDIKLLLIESIQHATKTGELSIEQKRGIITLFPTKDKSRYFLKTWKPISLLNTNYKIIAKPIANRLKNVLVLLINNDQTGYLKNRYIGENIRLLQDISFLLSTQRHLQYS